VGETNKQPWHEAPKGEIHKRLFPYLRELEGRQSWRDRELVTNLGLYEDAEVLGIAPGLYVQPQSHQQMDRVSLPIIGALCDTATNMIAQTQPRAMALTEGGDWQQQQRAKRLNHFLEGQFYSLRIFDTMQDAFADCTWAGDGVIYIDREGDKPIVERVFPGEMIVDQALCEFSDPYEMTRRKYVPRDKILRLFPKHAAAINEAKPVQLHGGRRADLIAVYTTWRLPMDAKAPGKRVVCIQTATLQVDPYKRDYFPFVWMRWRKQRVGFHGRGIPSIGHKLQRDINKTVRTMSRSVALNAIPRLLLTLGSNVNTEQFTNEIGSGIWHAQGMAPQWMNNTGSVPAEGMVHLRFEIEQLYQITGISELAAGMQKPAGLNSGEAQRVYHDRQKDRLALPSQSYENAAIEISKRLIAVAREIAEDGNYYSIFPTTNGFQRIDWKDVDLAEDEYTLKLWPVNYLSKSPAMLLAQVNDLITMGLISGKQAKRLIPFPDIEGVLKMENASEELAEKVVEEIVENDNYIAPEPLPDLQSSIKIVQNAAIHYATVGLPRSKLRMLHAWVANAMLISGAATPPAPPAEAPGAPGAPTDIAGLPPAAPAMAPPPALLPS
jgi:hypothetical protein